MFTNYPLVCLLPPGFAVDADAVWTQRQSQCIARDDAPRDISRQCRVAVTIVTAVIGTEATSVAVENAAA